MWVGLRVQCMCMLAFLAVLFSQALLLWREWGPLSG